MKITEQIQLTIRILVQLGLVGPMFIYFPFAVMMGIGGIGRLLHGQIHMDTKDFAFLLGWLGILGLIVSIFLPPGSYHRRQWLRVPATILLGCGFVTTGAILMSIASEATDRSWGIFRLWILGGPVVVGLWNLRRIWNPPLTKTTGNQPIVSENPAQTAMRP